MIAVRQASVRGYFDHGWLDTRATRSHPGATRGSR